MQTVRTLLTGVVFSLSVFQPALPAEGEFYTISLHSPESWARYYQRIGLGSVHQGPFHEESREELEAHCRFLTNNTSGEWIPLGYSRERGYKLCYRTGPFSHSQARVMCARLVMRVRQLDHRELICERRQDIQVPSA